MKTSFGLLMGLLMFLLFPFLPIVEQDTSTERSLEENYFEVNLDIVEAANLGYDAQHVANIATMHHASLPITNYKRVLERYSSFYASSGSTKVNSFDP